MVSQTIWVTHTHTHTHTHTWRTMQRYEQKQTAGCPSAPDLTLKSKTTTATSWTSCTHMTHTSTDTHTRTHTNTDAQIRYNTDRKSKWNETSCSSIKKTNTAGKWDTLLVLLPWRNESLSRVMKVITPLFKISWGESLFTWAVPICRWKGWESGSESVTYPQSTRLRIVSRWWRTVWAWGKCWPAWLKQGRRARRAPCRAAASGSPVAGGWWWRAGRARWWRRLTAPKPTSDPLR